jgi:hypothetical protein
MAAPIQLASAGAFNRAHLSVCVRSTSSHCLGESIPRSGLMKQLFLLRDSSSGMVANVPVIRELLRSFMTASMPAQRVQLIGAERCKSSSCAASRAHGLHEGSVAIDRNRRRL